MTSSDIFQIVSAVICSVIASSGFWAYWQRRYEKKDLKTKMLLGLAHDRIITLCMNYINRGWITYDEYENLEKYLYKPYKEMGGNGSAERLFNQIEKLQIRKRSFNEEE